MKSNAEINSNEHVSIDNNLCEGCPMVGMMQDEADHLDIAEYEGSALFHKIKFTLPDQFELRAEFQNFLADLHDNW